MGRKDKADREAAGVAPASGRPGRAKASAAGGRSAKAAAGGGSASSDVGAGVANCRTAVVAADEISFKLVFSSPATQLVYTVDRSNSSEESLAAALAAFAYSNIGDQAGVRA